ncbi:MAG: hypothetical protein KG012_03790 [Deltaproteobacteria bacterium]|nr:hypothetical protein [Deltaproteobacteria bacterium]
MKKLLTCLVILGIFFGVINLAMAGNTANQTVTYEVAAINESSVSGNPGALTVNAATAGSEPDEVTDSSTTYNITTNGTNKKITGQIDSVMPTGTTLKINLVAPTGGNSAGNVILTSSPADLVTGITKKKGSGLGITYKLSATVDAGEVAPATRTVTLTITSG